MVDMMIILNIESAIVGADVVGFIEFMISGNVKIKANNPNVSANLFPMISVGLSKMKTAPKNIVILQAKVLLL